MRKLMMAVATLAGIALTTGCQRNKNDEVADKRQELSEAQRDAAQKNADVNQDLNEKLAKDQRDAQKDMAEDQRDAQKDLAKANENVNEKQQDLAKAESEQQQERAKDGTSMAAATTVEGRVQSAGNDKLVLSVPGQANAQLSLKLDDTTRVLQNNREVKADDIQEGSQVRASYVTKGDDNVARDVTIVAPASNGKTLKHE